MKRRNLFLSLICSIMLAVALVTFTVISIVPTKNKTNTGNPSQSVTDTGNQGNEQEPTPENPDILINEGRDGSAELPYVIYSVDTFKQFVVDKYLDENGDYIDYNKVDENGELVYPELNAGLNYELDRDIDFAGSDFTTIFNKGIAFNGKINGKGFALKNISINVTKENIDLFTEKCEDGRFEAHIAIFGETNNASIKDVKVENISIAVAEDVYPYIKGGDFATEKGGAMREITIGSVSAIATSTTLENVTIAGAIDASAYAVYAVNNVQGFNAIGGVVGVAEKATLTNITTDIEIIAEDGKNFFIGGVAGYAKGQTVITKSNIDTDVKAHYEQALYIGGAVGYANGMLLSETNVTLAVADTVAERFSTKGVSQIADDQFTWVAGAVVFTYSTGADDANAIENVTIVANVDSDVIYAGVVMDIEGIAAEKNELVMDVIVESNVNVLKAFGFARTAKGAVITLTKTAIDEVNEIEYNVKLLGTVRLSKNLDYNNRLVAASVFMMNYTNTTITDGFAAVKPVVSYQIYAQLEAIDTIRPWGNKVNGSVNWAV